MIDLDPIKTRLGAIPPLGAAMPAEFSEDIYCRMAIIYAPEPNGFNPLVCVPAADCVEFPPLFDFIANAPTDTAALIGEIERLRSVLDGPPICACGSLFDEHHIAESAEGPACYLYTCQNAECGWQIGNNGEITERLTLRTNPQTERLIARIFR